MSPPRNTPNIGPNSMANEEARMRQALGLRNGPSGPGVPQRREAEQRGRRFVKDGEVPVVVVHSSRDSGGDGAAPVNRIAAAETLARNERTAREQAERALAEAQATIQHLRTQLVHGEMAHREALAAERRGREAAETALSEANEARAAAEARAAEFDLPSSAPPSPTGDRRRRAAGIRSGQPVGRADSGHSPPRPSPKEPGPGQHGRRAGAGAVVAAELPRQPQALTVIWLVVRPVTNSSRYCPPTKSLSAVQAGEGQGQRRRHERRPH